ncbi:hypothetical protein [Bradyrhizobium japonicum]|uniref:hypothetical protein n=1 Tax=Bradyrhizobium japonicum TaxID=375 RepID=UPI00142F30EA|nr:hypothetical protein [Bradyrhizobium japonicum]
MRRGPDALHDELAELLKQFNKTDKAVQEPQPPIKLLAKAETMTRSLVGLAKQVDLAKLVHLAKAKLPTLWPRGQWATMRIRRAIGRHPRGEAS